MSGRDLHEALEELADALTERNRAAGRQAEDVEIAALARATVDEFIGDFKLDLYTPSDNLRELAIWERGRVRGVVVETEITGESLPIWRHSVEALPAIVEEARLIASAGFGGFPQPEDPRQSERELSEEVAAELTRAASALGLQFQVKKRMVLRGSSDLYVWHYTLGRGDRSVSFDGGATRHSEYGPDAPEWDWQRDYFEEVSARSFPEVLFTLVTDAQQTGTNVSDWLHWGRLRGKIRRAGYASLQATRREYEDIRGRSEQLRQVLGQDLRALQAITDLPGRSIPDNDRAPDRVADVAEAVKVAGDIHELRRMLRAGTVIWLQTLYSPPDFRHEPVVIRPLLLRPRVRSLSRSPEIEVSPLDHYLRLWPDIFPEDDELRGFYVWSKRPGETFIAKLRDAVWGADVPLTWRERRTIRRNGGPPPWSYRNL